MHAPDQPVEHSFEIRQGGMVVASGSGPDPVALRREMLRYAEQYVQDGPIEIIGTAAVCKLDELAAAPKPPMPEPKSVSLTREEIEAYRKGTAACYSDKFKALCDMALRAGELETTLAELIGAADELRAIEEGDGGDEAEAHTRYAAAWKAARLLGEGK